VIFITFIRNPLYPKGNNASKDEGLWYLTFYVALFLIHSIWEQVPNRNQREPWSGAPDYPVCHRTVSGAPGWINSNSPPMEKPLRYNSPDCPVCHMEQRLQCNGRLQRKPEKRYSARTVRAEVRAAPEGAPDSEQWLSGAPPDCPVVPAVRAPTVEP
jgi:hypothetical protein